MNSYNLSIIQGDTFYLTLTVNDISGVPINLSGYTISGLYRNSYSSTGYINLQASGVIPSGGLISLSIPAQQTLLMPIGIGVYDVRLYSNTLDFKVLGGNAYVCPTVTF
jgi:hypothetical protein